jgi:hypothetical protein
VPWHLLPIFALTAVTAGAEPPYIRVAERYRGEVLQIRVVDGEGSRSGTCFPIYVSSAKKNPNVWFITAAHVILGEAANDYTTREGLKEVTLSSGSSAPWTIDFKATPRVIQIPLAWDSSGHDFALVYVRGFGRPVTPLPLSTRSLKYGDDFVVVGFPGGAPQTLPARGQVQAGPGEYDPLWYLVTGETIAPGMSGGPAFTDDGVFALVSGRDAVGKLLVPVGMAYAFVRTILPTLSWPAIARKERPNQPDAALAIVVPHSGNASRNTAR